MLTFRVSICTPHADLSFSSYPSMYHKQKFTCFLTPTNSSTSNPKTGEDIKTTAKNTSSVRKPKACFWLLSLFCVPRFISETSYFYMSLSVPMPKNSVWASDIMEISAMFPGFRFSPTDVELISHYLKRKIDGSDSSSDVIAQVEICKFEPWDLPEKSTIKSDHEWFFFAPNDKKYPNGSQAKRATQVGFWKATGKERDITSGKNVIGTKRTLVFHVGRAPKGSRTDWTMHEYCLKDLTDDKFFCHDSWVICRLRNKHDLPERGARSSTPSIVSDNLQQVQMGVHRDGEDVVVNSTKDDDCFADILKDDIVNLDYSQFYGDPMFSNVAECSTVQRPNLLVSSFESSVDHYHENARRRIKLENDRNRGNRGKMPEVGNNDYLELDEVEGGGDGDCPITCLAKSKNSLPMTSGWLGTIFVIMVVLTLFFLRVV